MTILLDKNYNFYTLQNAIGNNLYLSSKYKLGSYIIKQDIGNKILLYNTISGFLVEITKEEYFSILSSTGNKIIEKGYKSLIENYIIVKENFDDYSVISKVLSNTRYQTPIKDHFKYIDKYVIFTTLDCNARCFYCYEHGANKIKMSSKIATDVADFIINEYNRTKVPISISWFGGEPLYNIPAIDLITNKLNAAGVPFSSDFTSNGYLFTQEVIDKAKNNWNIKTIQITLDGTKDKYNKIKNYIGEDKNPFATVIENIKNLISSGIFVTIRLNVDLYNVDDLTSLTKYLYKEVGSHPNFSVYAHELFENIRGIKHTEEEKKLLFDKIDNLKILLSYYHFMNSMSLQTMKSCHCMPDAGRGITILPDGKVGQCEHYFDKKIIGDIYTSKEQWDYDVVKQWRDLYDKEDICKSCPLFAVCIPMKSCPAERICSEAEKEHKINDYRVRIKNVYDSIKIKNSSCCDCNSKSNYSEVLNKIANELELANDYKSLTLWERIKLLFGFDVYRDPHKKEQNNFNGK